VEFASNLPINLKMKVLNEKYLLKRSAEGLVPPRILARHKQPYRAPEARCFLEPAASEYIDDLLSESKLRRSMLFDPAAVSNLLAKLRHGAIAGIKDNMALVGVVSTQLLAWHFLDDFPHRIISNEKRSAEVLN